MNFAGWPRTCGRRLRGEGGARCCRMDLAAGPFGDKCARCIGRHPARGRSGARGTRRLVTLWEVAANGAGAFAASDAAGLVGPHGDLDAVSGAELSHEAREVGFHGAWGDVELAGDLIVGAALGYRHEEFLLAGGERFYRLPRW